MKFIAKDEDNEVISLTLHSECQGDKVRIAWLLAGLKSAAGADGNAGSTKAGS
ncbi:MAG TPA: hypothetical protein VGH51_02095 [Candidatus Angelobacter sp.]|jgi:hypothetical protein